MDTVPLKKTTELDFVLGSNELNKRIIPPRICIGML